MAATAAQFDIGLKRAYAPRSASDGTRILIDRLWPRGVTKNGGWRRQPNRLHLIKPVQIPSRRLQRRVPDRN
jgi:uncharacterized protein YeaO (DUF488 family)